jgi:Flp pilus assembly pilin Flp
MVPQINNMGQKGRTIQIVRLFIQDASGATVIEYALIGAIVSVSIIALSRSIGLEVVGLFDFVTKSFPQY